MYWLIDSTSGAISPGQAVGRQRRGIVLGTRGHRRRQPRQRPQPARHAEPDDAERQHDQQRLLLERAGQDLARQRLACLDGLAHQHAHQARLRGRHVVHRQAQRGHAQLLAAIGRVVEHRLERLGIRLGLRQVRIAGHVAAAVLADLVVDLAAVVGLEHLQRQVGQVDDHLALVQAHALADRLQRGGQGAIEGVVRGAHRALVGQPGIEREQAEQRREQPQRDLHAQVQATHGSRASSR